MLGKGRQLVTATDVVAKLIAKEEKSITSFSKTVRQ